MLSQAHEEEAAGARTKFHNIWRVRGRNAPHALVLDWWRRVDLALVDYFHSFGEKRPPSRREEERRIATDPRLGPQVASALSKLRRTRNTIAHKATTHAAADAAAYAEAALLMIGKLIR
jgi:hypothetical protein